MVLLSTSSLSAEVLEDVGLRTPGSTVQKSQTKPTQQLPQYGEPGFIYWNEEIEEGDTAFYIPDTITLDGNGYVPVHVFTNATRAVCKSVRTKLEPDGTVLSRKYAHTVTIYTFYIIKRGYATREFVVEYVGCDNVNLTQKSHRQKVVFYTTERRIPKGQIPFGAIGNASGSVSAN